jgi:hypothetical protein
MQCSRCKKEVAKAFAVKSKAICINCLTNEEMDELVKQLDDFWKQKS